MEKIRLSLPDVEGASTTVTGKHGETVVTSASPYDIPRFLELQVDRTAHRLIITFGYPDSEEATRQPADNDLVVLLGVNSGKLLGFEVENFTEKPGGVVVHLVRAIDNRMVKPARINQRLNFETVKGVVQNRVEKLLAAR